MDEKFITTARLCKPVRTEKYSFTDAELLNNFYQEHDNKWLGLLLERYTLLLLGVCMKYLKNEEEAKDSVQQIFLKAITELHKYRVEYFKSWIYMVAKNHCLMKLRDRKGKITADLSENAANVAPESQQDEKLQLLEKEKRLELMGSALQELGNEQKRCVTLFYLEKQSYQEIAQNTGYSILKVKSYIQNGKRNLRIMLDKKLGRI
ncbi:MAG: sigma-70 family RNA polymerase sigma factor [Williamsia sp.]|nr:sigma-70 family RNA polymerase sigma factor [Williamsia sp.]